MSAKGSAQKKQKATATLENVVEVGFFYLDEIKHFFATLLFCLTEKSLLFTQGRVFLEEGNKLY